MEQSIKDFLTYDYMEAKDLAKAFLTLVSAILIGTITFSEKIVNFQTATSAQRLLVIASWAFFVFAIIASGMAIVFDYMAVFSATNCQKAPCYFGLPLVVTFSVTAGQFLFLGIGNSLMALAGSLFSAGLLSLVISAVVAIYRRPDNAPSG